MQSKSDPSISGLNSQTARDLVECVYCGKPRVIYSKKKKSKQYPKALSQAKDTIDYRCGSVVASEINSNGEIAALAVKLLINTGLKYWNHVEFAYFSKTVGNLLLVLYSLQYTLHCKLHYKLHSTL